MDDEAFDRVYEAGAQSGRSERIAELEAALAASAERIEALTEALQRIADRFQKNGEDLHGFINATRDIARAALVAAPRGHGDPREYGNVDLVSPARTIDDGVKP